MQIEITLPRLHKKQQEVRESTAKRKIIMAGRRSGKTFYCAEDAVEDFLHGKRILYATPTQDQLQKFWHCVVNYLEDPIARGIFKKNESMHYIELEGTEQRIRAKTAWNADTLRGDYCHKLILDEFQLMNEDTWNRVGAPMLLDNDGDAVFCFTPPSFKTRSVTKADDPLHANKMYKAKDGDKSNRWQCFHFTSFDNPYINEEALENITDDMTEMAYRQEIMAEDIEEIPGALWTRKLLDETRVQEAPKFVKAGVGNDPQGRKKIGSLTGIIGGGLGEDDHIYFTHDWSVNMKPLGWGRRVIDLYDILKANAVIAERNFGGDLVESNLETIDSSVYIKTVNASRGKYIRAEPIAALFQKGKAHIVGRLPELEDEMCTYTPESRESPNRLDAMVWLGTYLHEGNEDWNIGGTTI